MVKTIPWLRILIEGVVIVFSVLVAFGIDAWWDDRQADSDLAGIVELLRSDIASDIEEMTRASARADSLLGRMTRVIELGRPGAEMPSADSLAVLVGATWSAASFIPSIAAFEVANGSDAWQRVPQAIRVGLSEYVDGFSSHDLALDVLIMKELVSLSGNYGGIHGLSGFLASGDGNSGSESWSPDGERLMAFVRDPHLQANLVAHAGLIANEQDWRTQWIETLAGILEDLEDV